MKKHLILCCSLCLALSFTGCSYDDDDLWNSLEEVENRLDNLEEAMKKANSDIDAIQKIVEALQNNVSVKEVKETASGYEILFSDGQRATISNGKDGADAPVISISKDTDGEYYWTSNGEWLLVDGQKMRASAKDGKDAVSPKVQINPETKEWEISTDNGLTWQTTGIVAQGDSFFQKVDTSNDDYVIFTLSDGTQVVLSKYAAFNFEIVGMNRPHLFLAGSEQTFEVKTFAFQSYMINKPNGWVVKYDDVKNTISVTAPAEGVSGAETSGSIDVMLVSEDAKCHIFKYEVKVYKLRTLTFEDKDYKNAPYSLDYCKTTINKWSDLIDAKQYNGDLLYKGTDADGYNWYDANNTELQHMLSLSTWFYTFRYDAGGHAVSNYVDLDLSHGTYDKQLALYYKDAKTGKGGHNGSDNFCVHYGYHDQSGYTQFESLPFLYFGDGVARVVDHMWVNNTTYFVAEMKKREPNVSDFVKIVAIADDDESRTCEFYLAKGSANIVNEWTKWDLSSLGELTTLRFNVVGAEESLLIPGYFAYDDVAVRFTE